VIYFNDTAKSSGSLMPKTWLTSEKLMGERNIMAVLFPLATNQMDAGSISKGVIGIFH
jgi:hypothetical protein